MLRPTRHLLLLVFAFVLSLSAAAQKAVSGKVLSETGEPLPNTSIAIQNVRTGEKKFLMSDTSGIFFLSSLNPDVKYNLYFDHMGYERDSLTNYSPSSHETDSLLIRLKASRSNLGEVVVVGYGTQKKTTIISSISTISKESLANRPLTNASQALQGAPGIFVSQASGGQPGADNATIRIRGVGTLNNNDPLVLVDGIAYSMQDVNPNDIESMSVLKDAAAASIYGNRAANGVILIKTKTGRKGKSVINYDNSFGIQKAAYLPEMVTNSADALTLFNRAIANQGTGILIPQPLIDSFRTNYGRPSDLYPSTNWFDIMLRNAFMQQHNLRFSGGSDKTVYAVSLGYMDQDGILIGTSAKKYSLATNLSIDVSPKLKVGLNLNGAYWIQDQSPTATSAMFSTIYRMQPVFNAKLANGNYADNWLPVTYVNGQNSFRNPYAMATTGINRTNLSNILANVYAEYLLPFHIKYRADFGVTKRDQAQKIFIPNVLLSNPNTGAANPLDWGGIADGQPRSSNRHAENNLNTTFFHTLNWDGKIGGKNNVNVLLGNSFERFSADTFDAYVEGLVNNSVSEMSNGTLNPKVTGTSSTNTLMSFFGRAGYNYDEKYIMEFSCRYDGSSRFAPGNRWGFFPALSAGWRIDREKFFEKLSPVISYLKLRGSWGQLGNQNIANFSYLTSYTNAVAQGYTFGGANVPGAAVTRLPNPGVSWERTTTTNIGMDAAFFNSKLSVSFDYFNRFTTGILTNLIIPDQIGNLNGPIVNLFSMRNKGFEIVLGYKDKIGKLGYDINGNFSLVDNKVVSMNGQQQINGLNILKEGYPVNSFYLLQATGIFQDTATIKSHALQGPKTVPGDLIYQDQDGNKVINGSDRVITGRAIPKYTYSFTIGLNYAGVDLSAFFQGVGDVNTYLTSNGAQPFANGAGVTKEWLTDSWRPDNPGATLPRITTVNGYTQNFQGIAGSTWWLKDASYLRLKNLQIGYTLPRTLLSKAGIVKARIFFNAQNLLTFSRLKMTDPENVNRPARENNITTTTDLYAYPTTKIFTGGISVTL